MSQRPCRLELRGITKVYPSVTANSAIDLSVEEGSIHAVLGENGAGKSTLMKIIYGTVKADAGDILWEGQRVAMASPGEARRLGIVMVFQHFSLFPALTVLDNLVLSQSGRVDRGDLARRSTEVSLRYGVPIDTERVVHSLSVGERQRVEIVRCLLQSPKLLIMDEPTSVLNPQAIAPLFRMLRQLAAEGCSIVYISHKLHEVQQLCETATILRQGRVVATVDPRQESTQSLARHMIGSLPPSVTRPRRGASARVRLAVRDLVRPRQGDVGVSLEGISFSVNGGEILGIAGIAGNGQAELLEVLSGEARGGFSGVLELNGGEITSFGVRQRRDLGLVYVPEERLGRGAVPTMSLSDNALLTSPQSGLVWRGLIDRPAVAGYADRIIAANGVRCAGHGADANTLSGGNLQKFIVGRELSQSPSLVIAAQPTWGLDVGAAATIRQLLLSLTEQGVAVLVLSEDLEELFEICDRLAVLARGRLSPVRQVDATSVEEIGRWMGGDFATGGGQHAGARGDVVQA